MGCVPEHVRVCPESSYATVVFFCPGSAEAVGKVGRVHFLCGTGHWTPAFSFARLCSEADRQWAWITLSLQRCQVNVLLLFFLCHVPLAPPLDSADTQTHP